MASYNELNALIDAYINRNGVQAITGQILNGVLKAMVEQIGRGYAIMGVADLATDPGTPDAPESWFASTPGTYTNFGGLVVADAEFAIFSYTPQTETWEKTTLTEGIKQIVCATHENGGHIPNVEASYEDGVLTLDFYNLQGLPGENTTIDQVTANLVEDGGQPGASVATYGTETTKSFAFTFKNLKGDKGETGVTSVVATVDNTTGTPTCTVSLVGQQLTLAFTGLKGAQGNTGSSVDYPFTIVNNLTTDDATQALSAAQGVVLQGEITQLEAEVTGMSIYKDAVSMTPGTVAGRVGSDANKYNPSSSNYINADYTLTAGRRYHIDANITRALANVGCISFIEGTLPTSGSADATVLANMAVSLVSQDFIPPANGHLLVTYLINNVTYVSSFQVKEIKYIDFQNEIDDTNADIEDLDERVTAIESDLSTLNDSKVLTDISESHQTVGFSYLNASSGDILSQSESTGRQVFYYPVKAGEKYKVTCSGMTVSPTYAFIGFFPGTVAPEIGDTATVLQGYTASNITKEISVAEDGFILLGFIGGSAILRYGCDWRIYRYEIPTENAELHFPHKILAVVGDTLQLFKRAIVKDIDPYIWDFDTRCTKGNLYPRYFQYTPVAADTGNVTLSAKLKNIKGQIIDEKETTIAVHSAPTSPASMKKIAIFGDSLTQGGQFPVEVARRLLSNDVATATMPAGDGLTNLKFIGGMGDGNARYFGVGGWSWKSYATAGNPAFRFQVTGVTSIVKGAVYSNNGFQFTVMENNTTGGVGNILCSTSAATNVPSASGTLTKVSGNGDATITFTSAAADQQNPLWDADNEAVSFSRYLSNIGEDTVDCVVFLLGWNEMSPDKKDFSTTQEYMETVINALHEQYPSAIVKILGLQLPSLNGGLGTNYGANGGYADKFGIIKSVFNYNDFLQGFADDDDYSSFVEFVDVASQFDSENNMPEAETQVNTRNSKTEFRGTNGVHPANPGYMQIADVLYRAIIHEYC